MRGGERRQTPDRISGRKNVQKARAAQLRPARLPLPDIGERAKSERLRKRRVDDAHLVAGLAHHFGAGGVFRDLFAEPADAAGIFKVGAAPHHGLALREAEADRVGEDLPARLIAVEEGAFDLGPEIARARADRRRADESGFRVELREQPLHIIARHQHVGIREHHEVVRAPRASP